MMLMTNADERVSLISNHATTTRRPRQQQVADSV